MKVIAVFALFIASACSSAVWPYTAYPYAAAHVAHHAPITQYSTYPAAHVVASPAISYAHHVAAPHVVAPYAAHVAAPHAVVAPYAAPYAAHVAHVAPVAKVVIPHAASYTAANRGSVHTAPLPGHAVSQTSLNLAPAPGTH